MYLNTVFKYKYIVFKYNVFKYNVFKYCPALVSIHASGSKS